jgi:hypothetical protein
MAATVSKVTPGTATPPTARKNRVARVTAKRPKKEAADEAEVDVEIDDEEVEVVEKPARADGGTYLSMYFKDMALLDVLRPEEEFTAAREIEALEIMLWEAVLAHPQAIERILDAIQDVPDFVMPVEAKSLRRLAENRDAKGFARASARAARKLRSGDCDHLFIEAALGAIDRMTLGIGVRGADVATLGTRGRARSARQIARRPTLVTRSSKRTFASSSASRAASITAAWRSPISSRRATSAS